MASQIGSAFGRAIDVALRHWRWQRRVSCELMLADRARRCTERLEPRVLLTGYGIDFPGELPPSYPVGSTLYATAAADVDGDGYVDLITANNTANTVSVLRNNRDGSFAPKVDYGVGFNVASVTAADVNGDGKVDLISANAGSSSVSVLRNNGNGSFAAKVDYATGFNPNSVTAADVNGDGKIDLISANGGSSSVSVLRNNGNGTFAAKVDYAVTRDPISVAATPGNPRRPRPRRPCRSCLPTSRSATRIGGRDCEFSLTPV